MRRTAVILFLTALALYTPAIWWGLPYATAADRIRPWGSDELAPLGPLAELYSVATRSPVYNPQYPLFQYVMEAGFAAPYMGYLRLTGRFSHPSTTFPYGLSDPVSALRALTLLERLVNLLMAAGVVVAAWRLGSRLWNPAAGIGAGVCVLLLYPMFYYSRTSNVDMGALFWTALGLLAIVECLRDGFTPARAAWVGLLAALATATKDSSYAAFVPLGLIVLAAEALRLRRAGQSWLGIWKPAATLIAVGAAVYVVASGAVFDPARYRGHVAFVLHGSSVPGSVSPFYFSTPATLAGYAALLRKTLGALDASLGLPMLLAAVAGAAFCARYARATLVLLAACAGLVAGVILPVRFVEFRFVLLIAFILALYAGYALSMVARRSPHAAALCVIMVCGWALVRGEDLTLQMLHDSRYETARWLKDHARPGDLIGYYGSPLKLPAIAPDIQIAAMPGQFDPTPPLSHPPEFILVIPQQVFEPVHERSLPESGYLALSNGSTGYVKVRRLQAPSLFKQRPVTFVNPPVEIYVRADRRPGPLRSSTANTATSGSAPAGFSCIARPLPVRMSQ